MLETLLLPNDVNERCGLILKDGTVIEVTNIAPEPALGYDMSPEEVLPHLRAGAIAGTWHTHPDTEPNLSGEDYKGFLAYPALEHSIIGRRNGETVVRRYRVENGLVLSCD